MRIIEDFIVNSQQWAIMDASSGDNYLIGRITMKFTWKLGRFNRYLWCQLNNLNTRISESRVHPFVKRTVQNEFFDFHKFSNFPA